MDWQAVTGRLLFRQMQFNMVTVPLGRFAGAVRLPIYVLFVWTLAVCLNAPSYGLLDGHMQ